MILGGLEVLSLFFTTCLGFFASGYFATRALLGLCCLASSICLSLHILFISVLLLNLLGIDVTWFNIVFVLGLISTIFALMAQRKNSVANNCSEAEPSCENISRYPANKLRLLLIPALLSSLLLLFRFTMHPLYGVDTPWRWEFLAIKLLEQKSLWFYPPASPEAYKVYFYPDAIPPMVQLKYWLLYAAIGQPHAPVLALALLVQLLGTYFCVYRAAENIFSKRAGCYAVLSLSACHLFAYGVGIGQENGLLVFALSATLYFLSHPKAGETPYILLAAAAAALGALSREYGGIYLFCALAMITWRRLGIRNGLLFTLSFAALCTPWYCRSWLITGNPFFNMSFGGLFPVNETHSTMLGTYGSVHYSEGTTLVDKFFYYLRIILTGALAPVVLGLLSTVLYRRKLAYVFAIAPLIVLTWQLSIGYTYGPGSSVRVLIPLFAVLAVASGGLGDLVSDKPRLRLLLLSFLATFAISSTLYAAVFPMPPTVSSPSQVFSLMLKRPNPWNREAELNKALANELPQPSRILSDFPYLHARFDRDIVPIWSPEVSFLFKAGKSAAELKSELLARGIAYIAWDEHSLNKHFLQQSALFSDEERSSWHLLKESAGLKIYALSVVG